MEPTTILDSVGVVKSASTYIWNKFGAKRKAAEVAAKNSTALRRLEKVERELSDLCVKVEDDASKYVTTATQGVVSLYDSIKPPNAHGTLKDRMAAYAKEEDSAQALGKLITPLEASVELLYANISEKELKALNDYITFARAAYIEAKNRRVDLVGKFRSFEDTHKGTAIADVVKRYRTALPRGPDHEVLNYFEAIYAKVLNNPPRLSPNTKAELGKNGKWRVDFNRNKPRISAKYGFFQPAVVLDCIYSKGKAIPSLGTRKSCFTIECIVKNGSNSELEGLAESYKSGSSTFYFFDAKNTKLHYNKDNVLAELFSGYFDLNKSIPPTYSSTLEFIFAKGKSKEELVRTVGSQRMRAMMKKGDIMPGFEGAEPVYVNRTGAEL